MKYHKTLKLCAASAAALAITGLSTATANAAFTRNRAHAPGEKNILQVINDNYSQFGGKLHGGAGNGWDATNGQVYVQRVNDSLDQIFEAPGGFTSNLVYMSNKVAQDFGYFEGESGSTRKGFTPGFHRAFHIQGSGGVTKKSAQDPTGTFRFTRSGPYLFATSSQDSDNSDNMDHMVTYMVKGLNVNEPVLLLFFEDLSPKQASDFDYQDLVVEVRGARLAEVPTPAAFGAGLAMLGGVLLRRRRHAGLEA